MSDTYDIAIVGAGPAGSSAAIRLATAGQRVVLIEKAKFPREKLCGEFISPECLEHFAELGVLEGMLSAGGTQIKETIFYGRGGRGVAVPSAMFGGVHANALGLSRAEMDRRLLERARDVGVAVLDGTRASELLTTSGKVRGLKLQASREVIAPIVLDATGRTRALAREVDTGRSRAASVAFKTHVRGVDIPEDRCEIFSYRGGYGGTSRVEGGLHNLCFIVSSKDVKRLGSDAKRVFSEVVCSNKRAAHVFRNVEFKAEWLAVPIERFGRGALSPVTGLLTIGDAAAFIDPFTGSGMLLAFESARLAAESILVTADVAVIAHEYERRYSAAFDRRLRVCSWLRRASFVPWLAEGTIALLALSEGLKSKVVDATRHSGTRRTEGV
jgi:flavin-dependent dehydrogenase